MTREIGLVTLTGRRQGCRTAAAAQPLPRQPRQPRSMNHDMPSRYARVACAGLSVAIGAGIITTGLKHATGTARFAHCATAMIRRRRRGLLMGVWRSTSTRTSNLARCWGGGGAIGSCATAASDTGEAPVTPCAGSAGGTCEALLPPARSCPPCTLTPRPVSPVRKECERPVVPAGGAEWR